MDILGTGSNILLIILGFGLLIALHELGHFIAARWAGIRADGFAIGMGPVVASYRGGVGFRFGACDDVVKKRLGRFPIELSDEEMAKEGLGETQDSLRLLPVGGYVRMLGQEDGNPNATSRDARSYTSVSVGKRMVVVSAGVVMNLITAIVMFVVAFMVGVRFEAPVVGPVQPDSPAAVATSSTEGVAPGIRSGDRITRIGDSDVMTFSDVMIESAMSVPDRPLSIEVDRPGRDAPLRFEVEPAYDERMNMRMIGIAPAASNQLASDPQLETPLETMFDASMADRMPGRTIVSAGSTTVGTWEAFDEVMTASNGRPVEVGFGPGAEGEPGFAVSMTADPIYERILYAEPQPEGAGDWESGLLGLTPLVRITGVVDGSRNAEVLAAGDIVLQVADVAGPRMSEFRGALMARPGRTIPILVERDGVERRVEARTDAEGRLGVMVNYALDDPRIARPFEVVGGDEPMPASIAALRLMPRTRIDAVGTKSVEDWPSFRAALVDAVGTDGATETEFTWTLPVADAAAESGTITISKAEGDRLRSLGWTAPLPGNWFEPLQTTLSAGGDPILATMMGFRQTWKMVVLTYLTIDRLVGGSVSVKQLHGPVGIVHIGTRVADRGFMYLIFFLAMISVNLAVLNFLPLPIVDGGLFLFLLYEKFFKKPPSIAFQNAATLVGLALIGTLFVVTFYNDVLRLTGAG
ncbi:MAG: site-2 protease family protein [Phycisphaerales bacterium]|nr:site-2 protease family protein [Phycisphaerales bacterium]